MITTLSSIKNRSLTFLEGQLGAVAFEYLLVIGGVSVVVIGLLAVGANALMPELIEAICEGVVEMEEITDIEMDMECEDLFDDDDDDD